MSGLPLLSLMIFAPPLAAVAVWLLPERRWAR